MTAHKSACFHSSDIAAVHAVSVAHAALELAAVSVPCSCFADLGVNRMALKYHVGIKISGVIQSVGATDSELAAHILLDLVSTLTALHKHVQSHDADAAMQAWATGYLEQRASTSRVHSAGLMISKVLISCCVVLAPVLLQAKIGLGLYSPAAGAATPHASVHADEQMTQQLMAPAYRYSSQLVQRVVAQLINRSLVPASELLHAYSRAHGAGCRPGPCLMSVSAALSSSTAQCVTRVTQ